MNDVDKYFSIRSSNKKKKKKKSDTKKWIRGSVPRIFQPTNEPYRRRYIMDTTPTLFLPASDIDELSKTCRQPTTTQSINKVGCGYKVYGDPVFHQNARLYSDAFRNSLPGGLVDSRHVSFSSSLTGRSSRLLYIGAGSLRKHRTLHGAFFVVSACLIASFNFETNSVEL